MTAVPATPSTPAAGAAASVDPVARRVPAMGGLNGTLVRIELKRMLRNRRTIVFALVFPTAMFFVSGPAGQPAHRRGRQRVGLRDGLDGDVRRRADRGIRGSRGRRRTGARVVAALRLTPLTRPPTSWSRRSSHS